MLQYERVKVVLYGASEQVVMSRAADQSGVTARRVTKVVTKIMMPRSDKTASSHFGRSHAEFVRGFISVIKSLDTLFFKEYLYEFN